MKHLFATLCVLLISAAAAAAALTPAQKSFLKNRRICVNRDTTTLPGYVITTWHRNGKPDTKAPAVVTNRLQSVVGAEQKNHLQAKLAELQTVYASVTNRLLNAETRAARLDAFRAYLVEKRDAAPLQTTKAIYQALIDRIDGAE